MYGHSTLTAVKKKFFLISKNPFDWYLLNILAKSGSSKKKKYSGRFQRRIAKMVRTKADSCASSRKGNYERSFKRLYQNYTQYFCRTICSLFCIIVIHITISFRVPEVSILGGGNGCLCWRAMWMEIPPNQWIKNSYKEMIENWASRFYGMGNHAVTKRFPTLLINYV